MASAVRAGLIIGWGLVAAAEASLVPYEGEGDWRRPFGFDDEAQRPRRHQSDCGGGVRKVGSFGIRAR